MKLRDEVEPRLEVVASEPRLDVREPRLLPDEQERVLADRLEGAQTEPGVSEPELNNNPLQQTELKEKNG